MYRRNLLLGSAGALALPVLSIGCGGAPDCTDTSQLSATEAKQRTDQNYLDTAADPTKACAVCEQYVPPEKSGCGSCKVLKGPIQAKGSCNLFVAKA